MMKQQWIRVPGGELIYRVRHRIMEGDCAVEHGPVTLKLEPFEIMKYPVTNAMYSEFVQETGYCAQGNFLAHLCGADIEAITDHPVVFVSQQDAEAYAHWAQSELPCEAEWVMAAGGADGRRWPWGDVFDAARVNGEGDQICAVDAHPLGESPLGVADLCGNAWEWTRGEAFDGHHRFALLRGGSCYRAQHFWHMQGGAAPLDAHVKMPLLAGDLNRAATLGFRCVRRCP